MINSNIKLLDDTSINKIAAGEVIDRPSSVVKELVENALDAGANRIEIEIEAGGVGKIRITDDGCGMSEQDVRMAVLRHATSKLNNADDLMAITSMGFRGEAIPSIASVSKFSLISRQAASGLGTRLEIAGGQLLEVVECGAEIGTVVAVTDLFFNTPARLKFMKTAAAESSHIHEVLVKLAIARPEVIFRLSNNGRSTLQTPGTGRLSDTLSALYGPEIFTQLFPVDYNDAGIHITGFTARPSIRKGTRQWQSFSINRRVIGSRMINRAIDTAYQNLLPSGSYPLVVLQLDISASFVDVNVHPQKTEVKFQDERAVFRAVHSALKQTLTLPQTATELAAAFDHSFYHSAIQPNYIQESLPVQQDRDGGRTEPDLTDHTANFNNWGQQVPCIRYVEDGQADGIRQGYAISQSSLSADSVIEPQNFPQFTSRQQNADFAGTNATYLQALAQFKLCYILATDGNCLYIIDQHAAHERIMFDILSRQQSPTSFQTLLIPLILDLDPLEVHAAEAHADDLAGLGFVFDWIGPSNVRLSELPTHIPPEEAAVLFRQILSAALNYKLPDMESLRKAWIETAACHMAVRAGQSMNRQQMQGLLDDLIKTERPYACPHGRPTLIRLTDQDLAKLFKRI